MRRRVVSSYREQNVHAGWRRKYGYLQHAGVTAKIKRLATRRERREGKAECQEEARDRDIR